MWILYFKLFFLSDGRWRCFSASGGIAAPWSLCSSSIGRPVLTTRACEMSFWSIKFPFLPVRVFIFSSARVDFHLLIHYLRGWDGVQNDLSVTERWVFSCSSDPWPLKSSAWQVFSLPKVHSFQSLSGTKTDVYVLHDKNLLSDSGWECDDRLIIAATC